MRQTLQQRIADGLQTSAEPRDDQAKLVEDFARILRETAAAAAASRPGGPDPATASAPHFELPQILQPKPIAVRENRRPVADWLTGVPGDVMRLIASAPITAAVCVAGLVLVALVWRGDVTFLKPAERIASAPVQVQAVRTVAVTPARERDKEELSTAALLAQADRLISDGNVIGARELIGRAALSGDAGARFALAETFDPNVLAAWGLRGVSADPSTARLLYEQALASGEPRAERRLKALRSD